MLTHNVITLKPTIYSEAVGEYVANLCAPTFIMPWGDNNIEYQMFVTTDAYVARPDLVSLYLYNDTKYTDLICKINGISNPFELNSGQLLLCPRESCLSSFYIDANKDFDDDAVLSNDDAQSTPTAKKPNEKRAANEATINDKRFNIDINNRTVVY